MAPLFILIVASGVAYVVSAVARRSLHGQWTTALRVGLASMFATTGVTHFVVLREDLIALVPPALPSADVLVTVTGVLELAGAAGLLWRPTARWAAAGLACLLVAVFPANVYAALAGIGIGDEPPTSLGVRTALQLVYLGVAVSVWMGLRRESRQTDAGHEGLTRTLTQPAGDRPVRR